MEDIVTKSDITTEIEQLQQKADEARDDGNAAKLYRTLCEIDELSDEMGVQPHEFGGGE